MIRPNRSLLALAGALLAHLPGTSHSQPDLIASSPPPWMSHPAVPNFGFPSNTLDTAALLPFTTVWQISNYNQGDQDATSPFNFATVVTLDDRDPCTGYMAAIDDDNVPPGSWGTGLYSYAAYYDVKPGRHTARSIADLGCGVPGYVTESDETNNEWDRQFIWGTAGDLAIGLPVTSTYDPPFTSPGFGPHYNAEGFSGSTGANYWYAFATLAPDPTGSSLTDFDIRLNTEVPLNVPQQGFGNWVAWSSEVGAPIDFVIVDRNTVPGGTYYASVLNWWGTQDKAVEFDMDKGLVASPGTSGPFDFAAGALIELHEIYLQAGYQYQIDIQPTFANVDIGLSVYNPSSGFAAKAETVPGGYANNAGIGGGESVTITPATSDYHGIAVWKTNGLEYFYWTSYNVVVTQTPLPNVAAGNLGGWYGPIVPRDMLDTTPTYAPLPAALSGNTPTTSMNWSVINNGIGTAPNFWTELLVDDVSDWLGYFVGTVPPSGFLYWSTPFESVRGGRHHVRMRMDIYDTAIESNESDNDFTDWFVWSPLDLANQVPVLRSPPPLPYPVGAGPYPSSDGFRTPGLQGSYWTAVGVIPTSMSADYDLRLHTASTGSKNGFDFAWASSLDPFAGNPDFLIVNYNAGPSVPYDFAVTNANGAPDDYYVHRSDAVYTGVLPAGVTHYGPTPLTAGACLNVQEFYVPIELAGVPIWISTNNVSGSVDLEMFLFDGTVPFHTKGSYTTYNNQNGPGGDEHVGPVTLASGFHAVVVAKSKAFDVSNSGAYEVVFSTGTSAVDAPVIESAPTTFALSAPRPNPFGGSTAVELAVPVGQGKAKVSVYDLQGRRVAELAEQATPGRHVVTWDGRDSAGRRVAAGIYFVRLDTPQVQQTRKITLLR
jgi:hypothetical protein